MSFFVKHSKIDNSAFRGDRVAIFKKYADIWIQPIHTTHPCIFVPGVIGDRTQLEIFMYQHTLNLPWLHHLEKKSSKQPAITGLPKKKVKQLNASILRAIDKPKSLEMKYYRKGIYWLISYFEMVVIPSFSSIING